MVYKKKSRGTDDVTTRIQLKMDEVNLWKIFRMNIFIILINHMIRLI